jgi:hypothetical protein
LEINFAQSHPVPLIRFFGMAVTEGEGPLWYLVHRVFCPVELFTVQMALTGSRQTYQKLEQLAATQVAGKRKWEM